MWVNRKEIEKIQDILSRFPLVESFKLDQSESSGIGCVTTMKFHTTINDVNGEFIVEISGVEDW